MKKHLPNIFLVFILILGLSLLVYPTLSNYWNSLHQSHAIAYYGEQVAGLDKDRYAQIWSAAADYNHNLTSRTNAFLLNDAQKQSYEELLNIGGTGIMGHIEIPSLHVSLPIYHGVADSVLQIGVGHLEWTSLPVGGESSHCVLSGHRGLPSAELFTHLDRLVEGDVFMLQILDEVLTYEVDQILIVEPENTKSLLIEPGQDLCTLVTCTPYGINSHRLLVRGHRIPTEEDRSFLVTADAVQIEPILVAPLVAAPILLVLFILLMIPKRKKM